MVRGADGGWTDIIVTAAVTRLALADLGQCTQIKRLPVTGTDKAIQNGKIDVCLGNGMLSMEHSVKPYLENGTAQRLNPNLEGAKHTLAANQATLEKRR